MKLGKFVYCSCSNGRFFGRFVGSESGGNIERTSLGNRFSQLKAHYKYTHVTFTVSPAFTFQYSLAMVVCEDEATTPFPFN